MIGLSDLVSQTSFDHRKHAILLAPRRRRGPDAEQSTGVEQAHEWHRPDQMGMRTMTHASGSSKQAITRSPMRIASLILTLTASGQPARAGFTITGATIAEGDLWIVGQVDEPNTAITLDDSFTENTDPRGRFEFRI